MVQRGRMSDRWQVDNRLASPLIGRRFMPVIAICGFLVITSGLILWATGGNSAAVVSPGAAVVAPFLAHRLGPFRLVLGRIRNRRIGETLAQQERHVILRPAKQRRMRDTNP